MSTDTKLPGFFTLDEAAAELSLSHSQVCRYVRSGRLGSVNLGGQYLIPEAALRGFVRQPPGNPNFRRKIP